ncbi:MAG: sigma-70 family RNA polymerase sigma factor [Patescibacteria group bacterium]
MYGDEDSILIERAQRSGEYFSVLYKKYADPICKYVLPRVDFDRTVAEDIMQDVFFRAFEHIKQYEYHGIPYKAYLFTIAHNLLINHYRDKKTVQLEEMGEDRDQHGEKFIDHVEMRMEAREIWHAVDALPQGERDTLLLRYKREMSVKEIAEVMHKTANAVKLSLCHGRKKLAKDPGICCIHNGGRCSCGGKCACRTGVLAHFARA